MLSNPSIILDEVKVKSNIKKMYDKALKNNLVFRPHFKTHQSIEIGQWYKEIGVQKITVSSVDMALYFINDDWNDITIAFPFNIHELYKINQIDSSIKINLVVESAETLQYLSDNSKRNFGLFIKIDIGYHRTGIEPTKMNEIERLVKISDLSNKVNFLGFLGHAGHSYNARSKKEIMDIHHQSLLNFKLLKNHFKERNIILSTGDTPTCSIAESFPYVNEIRPGNFVFYDVTQAHITSCTTEDIAITLKCPIVSKNEERKEILIYGGGVHFSKDRVKNKSLGKEIYGIVDDENIDLNHIENYVSKLSQEHGTITVNDKVFNKYQIGDFIEILPIHSCMTSNLMKEYYTKENNKLITRL